MDYSDTGTSPRPGLRPRAGECVTALYAEHAVGLIRLGFVMLGGGEVRFYTFPLAASTTATAKGRLDASLRIRDNRAYGYLAEVLWASPSGGTLIGLWIREVMDAVSSQGGSSGLVDLGPHIGVISHGKFAPLHFPAGFTLYVGYDGIPIAW